MTEHDRYRPAIPALPAATPRPLWSVMIPTYNCAGHLRTALAAVLAQDRGPEQMQIEVVDDCSTQDDPAAVVAELGDGRVGFYQQPRNVGHVGNFNTCLARSRGRLIHLLHGDDAVRPGFYAAMERVFDAHPEVGAAFCRCIYIDEDNHWMSIARLEQRQSGVLHGWLERIVTGQRLQPPCIVVRREVYERVGGFDERVLAYGEDWEMWVRIAAHCAVWYEAEPLAIYRIQTSSLSGRAMRSGQNGRDLRRVIAINAALLPPSRAKVRSREARENNALGIIRRARRLLARDEPTTVLRQLWEALLFTRSPEVVLRALMVLALLALRLLGRVVAKWVHAGKTRRLPEREGVEVA